MFTTLQAHVKKHTNKPCSLVMTVVPCSFKTHRLKQSRYVFSAPFCFVWISYFTPSANGIVLATSVFFTPQNKRNSQQLCVQTQIELCSFAILQQGARMRMFNSIVVYLTSFRFDVSQFYRIGVSVLFIRFDSFNMFTYVQSIRFYSRCGITDEAVFEKFARTIFRYRLTFSGFGLTISTLSVKYPGFTLI